MVLKNEELSNNKKTASKDEYKESSISPNGILTPERVAEKTTENAIKVYRLYDI